MLLPLVILLICFGFSLGKEVRVQRNFSKAYERGYRKGRRQISLWSRRQRFHCGYLWMRSMEALLSCPMMTERLLGCSLRRIDLQSPQPVSRRSPRVKERMKALTGLKNLVVEEAK